MASQKEGFLESGVEPGFRGVVGEEEDGYQQQAAPLLKAVAGLSQT